MCPHWEECIVTFLVKCEIQRVFCMSGVQNLEWLNVGRSIFRNFKITNIRIANDELFDYFIYEFIFYYYFLKLIDFFQIIKFSEFFKLLNFKNFIIFQIKNNKFIKFYNCILENWKINSRMKKNSGFVILIFVI